MPKRWMIIDNESLGTPGIRCRHVPIVRVPSANDRSLTADVVHDWNSQPNDIWAGFRVASWLLFLLSVVWCCSGGLVPLGIAQQPTAPDVQAIPAGTVAYLLVIDHSGSMNQRMPDNSRTRWQEMQHHAIELVRRIPLGSRLWIAVFSTTPPRQAWIPSFQNEQDREQVIKRLQGAFGSPQGETALYDTLAMAFEEADRLSFQFPNRQIAILAYTDGEDNKSRIREDELRKRFQNVVQKNPNLWLYYRRIPGDGKPLENIIGSSPNAREGEFYPPLVFAIANTEFVLENPHRDPEQSIDFHLIAADQVWEIIRDHRLNVEFRFEPDDNQPIQIEATPIDLPTIAAQKGRCEILLKVKDFQVLKQDQSYSGTLHIEYPKIPGYDINAPNRIRLLFQKGGEIEIFARRPTDNAVFAVNRPILFEVKSLHDADVEWILDDAEVVKGHQVVHSYNKPGRREITVRVSHPKFAEKKEQKFSIDVVELSVRFKPITAFIFGNEVIKFECDTRGPIDDLDWIIDGVKWAGEFQKGQATGAISFRFDNPVYDDEEVHRILIVGKSPVTTVLSDEVTVRVLRRPTVSILQPQADSTLYFKRPYTFVAKVEGPVDAVKWIVRKQPDRSGQPNVDASEPKIPGQSGADGHILVEQDRPVRKELTGQGQATWDYKFEEGNDKVHLVVEAYGVLRKEYQAYVQQPVASVNILVDFVPLALQLTSPSGTDIPYKQAERGVFFQLKERNGEQLTKIEWDFGDGQPSKLDQRERVQHSYVATGEYTVTATAHAKGGRVGEAKVTIVVSAERPVAKGYIHKGGRPVARVQKGDQIQLISQSTGDIVETVWEWDGKRIEPAGFTVNDPGRHVIALTVKGPPNRDGDQYMDTQKFELMVANPNWPLFLVIALVTFLVAAILHRLVTGNTPCQWRLGYCATRPPGDGDGRVKLKNYWNYWTKKATVPMKQIFSAYEYWGNSGDQVIIRYGKTGGEYSPLVEFSAEGNPLVDFRIHAQDKREMVYELTDRRCHDERCRKVYLALIMVENFTLAPYILLMGILTGLFAIISYTAFWCELL